MDRRTFLKSMTGALAYLGSPLGASEAEEKGQTYVLLIGGERCDVIDVYRGDLLRDSKQRKLEYEMFGGREGLEILIQAHELKEDRFFATIASAYESLRKRGVPLGNFSVFHADGKADVNGTLRHNDSHEEMKEKLRPVSKDDVLRGLADFGEIVGEKDTLIVAANAHGIYDGEEKTSYLKLAPENSGYEYLHDHELHKAMSRIKGRKLIVIDACYAGGFANPFLISENTVVAVSTDKETKGQISNKESFLRAFFSRVREPVRAAYHTAVNSDITIPEGSGLSIFGGINPGTYQFKDFNPSLMEIPLGLASQNFW